MKRSEINGLPERVWGPRVSVNHPQGGRVWVRPPELLEIPQLNRLLHEEVSADAGSADVMAAVFAHNSDCLWVIERFCMDGGGPNIAGFYAMLLLNEKGKEALEAGTLNRTSPSLELLVPFGEKPAAIYIWAIVARRLVRRLMPLITRAMGSLYAAAPFYAFAATEDGCKACVGQGFSTQEKAEANIRLGSFVRLPSWNEGALAS